MRSIDSVFTAGGTGSENSALAMASEASALAGHVNLALQNDSLQ